MRDKIYYNVSVSVLFKMATIGVRKMKDIDGCTVCVYRHVVFNRVGRHVNIENRKKRVFCVCMEKIKFLEGWREHKWFLVFFLLLGVVCMGSLISTFAAHYKNII